MKNKVTKKLLMLLVGVVVVLISLWLYNFAILDKVKRDTSAAITLGKVDNVPDNFVEITETDLDKYPVLRNILEEMNRTEGDRINYETGEIKGKEIVNYVEYKYGKKYDTPQRGGPYIKYKEDFYSIALMIE